MSSIEHDPNAAAERRAPDLTERQQRIMAAIRALHAEHGFAPSLREIGEACGLKSTSSVQHQLNVLESKGCIRRDPNKGRNENGHIWLIPHNPNYAPIDGTHAQIMGKVVTVLRKM